MGNIRSDERATSQEKRNKNSGVPVYLYGAINMADFVEKNKGKNRETAIGGRKVRC